MEEDAGPSREEPALGNVPSRAPSPQGSISRSAGGGGRSMRALVAHQPASPNPTLLPFSRGETVSVLVQQPHNGWLYGRADGGARQGWFPASFVEAVDEPPKPVSSSSSGLRSRASISNLINQPPSSSQSRASGPPPPPPPPSTNSSKPEVTPAKSDDRPKPENKASQPHRSHPELFPRGTNPFATVKLKPTATDDRSAPRLSRR